MLALALSQMALFFFENGVQHGPGYQAGSVTGPVVAAAELSHLHHAVRLHADAAFATCHAQAQ
jgi:hypothetical protein